MKVLVFSLTLFALAFILHFIIWKIRLPGRQIKTILQLFFGTLIAGIFLMWNAPTSFEFFSLSAPDSLWEYLHICLFIVSMTLAYMITYTAMEADSPSLVMTMTIGNAGANGLDKERFEELMSDDTLIKPRVDDILLDKMAYLDGKKYRLTPKGTLIALIFIYYRRLMNLEKGG